MSQTPSVPTLVGLVVVFAGPLLPVDKLVGSGLAANIANQVLLWLLFVVVITIVVRWEKRPLSSIGWRWGGQAVLWGLSLAAVMMFVTGPIGDWVLARSGLAGFETGFARLAALPPWFLLLAAVTAGVVEETLYRGYAIERLASFLGNFWYAGLIAWIVFSVSHAPVWGWGPVVSIAIGGVPLLVFYILKRDLLACMIAHAVTDGVGLMALSAEL